jgi:hypothetical protein
MDSRVAINLDYSGCQFLISTGQCVFYETPLIDFSVSSTCQRWMQYYYRRYRISMFGHRDIVTDFNDVMQFTGLTVYGWADFCERLRQKIERGAVFVSNQPDDRAVRLYSTPSALEIPSSRAVGFEFPLAIVPNKPFAYTFSTNPADKIIVTYP